MSWYSPSVVATLILGFIAASAIIIPIIRNHFLSIKNRNKSSLEQIIIWAETSLSVINKYPTVYFEQLDDLLLKLNDLRAQRYRMVINCHSLNDEYLFATFNEVAEALGKFTIQADQHSHNIGRKQRIPIPEILTTSLQKLLMKLSTLIMNL